MKSNSKLILRTLAIVAAVAGFAIIAWVFWPIVSYNLAKQEKFASFTRKTDQVDFTRASNWLPESKPADFGGNNVVYYTITIPRFKIENATVAIGGEDLAQNLIQYPGTAVPGKRGNAVIFGHSVLPQFFKPNDYISIFSKLQEMAEEDEIIINYDGITYKYRVENMIEVEPTNALVLEQNLSDSFVTLVTCTPPGDPRKPYRLVVKARIIPPEVVNATFRN